MAARSLETIVLLRRRAEAVAASVLGEASRARARADRDQQRLAAEVAMARRACLSLRDAAEDRRGPRRAAAELEVRRHEAQLATFLARRERDSEAHRRGAWTVARKAEAEAQAAWQAARTAREVAELRLSSRRSAVRAAVAARGQGEVDDRLAWRGKD